MLKDTLPIDTSNAQIYTDLNGLQQLKAEGKSNRAAALKQIAHQFESMMVQMMMKSMREANSVFSDGDPLTSSDSKFYQSMFDNQLALTLSQGRGFGIADAILRQLQGYGGATKRSTPPTAASTAVQSLPRTTAAAPATANATAIDTSVQDAIYRLFKDDDSRDGGGNDGSASAFDGTPQDFVEQLAPLARRVGDKLGVDSRVLLSQSALETGWGQRVLQCADGSSSYNFFNIKADDNWNGPVVKVPVVEYQNGIAVREWAKFRAYQSPEESFADYARLIAGNPRYRDALQCADNPRAFVQALAQAGYATDPKYAQKVLALFDSDHLQAAGSRAPGI